MKLIIVLCLFVALSQGNVVTKKITDVTQPSPSISSEEDLTDDENVPTNPNLTNKEIHEEHKKEMVIKMATDENKNEEITTLPSKVLMPKLKAKFAEMTEHDEEKKEIIPLTTIGVPTQPQVIQKQPTQAPIKPTSKNAKNGADNLSHRTFLTLIISLFVTLLLYVQF
ncbi:hypothetical protein PVAND_004317 [Polypedilum vanderplanki]|uniref:Uncharacterized protein n=1 Tax=Polypedilum vanderplanki TaxID=319348 RepID=A0A9J6BYS2_POLVA|nr:hypothetical protein PVAND_004317 [Polypedilum vanderplanki]